MSFAIKTDKEIGSTGYRIRLYRELTNISQTELGIRCGIKEVTAEARISQYERNKQTPRDKEFYKVIAKALKLNENAIFEFDFSNKDSLCHLFFELEEYAGLKIQKENELITLSFDNNEEWESILEDWLEMNEEYHQNNKRYPEEKERNHAEYILKKAKYKPESENNNKKRNKETTRITNVIREEREKRNLSQQAVADMLGINRRTYSSYEIGVRGLPVETLIQLADIFETSTDYLLGRNTETAKGE